VVQHSSAYCWRREIWSMVLTTETTTSATCLAWLPNFTADLLPFQLIYFYFYKKQFIKYRKHHMQENKESARSIPIPHTNCFSQESFIRNMSDHAETVFDWNKRKTITIFATYLLFTP